MNNKEVMIEIALVSYKLKSRIEDIIWEFIKTTKIPDDLVSFVICASISGTIADIVNGIDSSEPKQSKIDLINHLTSSPA